MILISGNESQNDPHFEANKSHLFLTVTASPHNVYHGERLQRVERLKRIVFATANR